MIADDPDIFDRFRLKTAKQKSISCILFALGISPYQAAVTLQLPENTTRAFYRSWRIANL